MKKAVARSHLSVLGTIRLPCIPLDGAIPVQLNGIDWPPNGSAGFVLDGNFYHPHGASKVMKLRWSVAAPRSGLRSGPFGFHGEEFEDNVDPPNGAETERIFSTAPENVAHLPTSVAMLKIASWRYEQVGNAYEHILSKWVDARNDLTYKHRAFAENLDIERLHVMLGVAKRIARIRRLYVVLEVVLPVAVSMFAVGFALFH